MDVLGKLVELRKKSGLTQAEVAEELGVSRQAVSRWETGEISPSVENLRRLSKLYGVPMDDLANGTAPEQGLAAPAEREGVKPRKVRRILIAAAVIMALEILLSAVVYIATVGQGLDIPIPIEDLATDTVSPAPEKFPLDW